ncbi:MAG: type II toxin-antitoxin system VapB family antitoxin [Pseudomonadota bacterium]
MATNLALNEELLEKALEVGHLGTKKATVNEALKEFIERRQQGRILDLFGKVDWDKKYSYKNARKR